MKRIGSILLVLTIVCILGLYFDGRDKVAVLGYHGFSIDESNKDEIMNVLKFEEEIAYLSKHNYHSITLGEMECYINKTCNLPRKSILITMDDGWMSEYTLALPILEKYNMKAVIFYVGSFNDGHNVNFMSQKEIDDLIKNHPNIEIASHSYNLHDSEAYLKDKDDLNNDFKQMENIVNTKYFAYPYGLYNDVYKNVLNDNGYLLAFNYGPERKFRKATKYDNRYEIPRLNMSSKMPMWKFKLRLLLPF